MQESGLNKIHRTGNAELDTLAVEVERAQAAAAEAASRAERANAGVLRLDSEIQRHGRHTTGSIVVLVLMAALIVAGAWWAHGVFKDQGLSLAKLPTLSESIDSVSNRLSGAEEMLSKLPDDWSNMTARMTSLEKRINSGFQSARRQIQEAVGQVDQKVQAGIDKQTAPLREQIVQLESKRESDAARIVTLDNELRSMQRDMNQQMASIRGTIPADPAPELARVRSEMARNSHDINAIADQLDRSVVNFEVAEDRSTQLTPGVYLNVSKMDVGKQQVNGWLYLANEHRTVWLHNQGLLKPITVHGTRDKQAQEVVLTWVNRNSAVGYVLVPKSNATETAN